MNDLLLVRHAEPYPTESLLGYILRLCEENGYESLRDIYALASMNPKDVRKSVAELRKLSAVTNWPAENLDTIAYSSPVGLPRWSRLLGHPVLPQDLNLTHPQFCPLCVRERGFLEAHWELSLMEACPVHQCSLLRFCPVCNRRIRWLRPGLLVCDCGGDLSNPDLLPIPDAEASLLDIVRRRALSGPGDLNAISGSPEYELTQMSLSSMLLTIRTIGKYRMIADGAKELNSRAGIVSAASRVFDSWPGNFLILVEDLNRLKLVRAGCGAGKQFGGVYRCMFQTKAPGGPNHADFLGSFSGLRRGQLGAWLGKWPAEAFVRTDRPIPLFSSRSTLGESRPAATTWRLEEAACAGSVLRFR